MMKFYQQLPQIPIIENSALAIGTFDGFHRGHQALIDQLKAIAKSSNLNSTVITFVDMPICYFSPDKCPHLLTLADEKKTVFEKSGIDNLLIIPFNKKIAAIDYHDFTKSTLVNNLGMKKLIAGPDLALGKNREGNIISLNELGKKLDFEVVVLDKKIEYHQQIISSTRVRESVERGNITAANEMLGRKFTFFGNTIPGKGWGRKLGIPTVNIDYPQRKVLPGEGVYAAWAKLDDSSQWLPAALSIGTNSSVGGKTVSVEFHIIGENIPAPKCASVKVSAWLREQRHFTEISQLITQMKMDIEQITQLLKVDLSCK